MAAQEPYCHDCAGIYIMFRTVVTMAPNEQLPKEARPALRLLDELMRKELGRRYDWVLLPSERGQDRYK